MPLISIIIPVFNTENYLEKCLYSATKQTYKNIEIIVIIDGSTDNSEKIARDFAKKDNRIKVFVQKNAGLAQTRNVGIKKSNGKYLFFLDSDDALEKKSLQKLYNSSSLNDSDITIGTIKSVGNNFEYIWKNAGHANCDPIKFALSNKIPTSVNCSLYKKDLFIKNNICFPQGIYYEDTITTLTLLFFATKINYIKKIVYIYNYKREYSITNSLSSKKISDLFSALDMMYNFLVSKGIYKTYKKDFLYFVLNSLIFLFSKPKEISNNSKKTFFANLASKKPYLNQKSLQNFEKKHHNKYLEFSFYCVKCSKETLNSPPIYVNEQYINNLNIIASKYNKINDLSQEVVSFLQKKQIDQIIVYGAGEIFVNMHKLIQNTSIKILQVIDKKAEKKTFKVLGYKVKSKKSLKKVDSNVPIVIASFSCADEIKKELEKYIHTQNSRHKIIDLFKVLK